MIRIHKMIATSLGIGYIGKGGGTVAAIFACICWYFALAGSGLHFMGQLSVTLCITIVGIWSSGKMEPLWGKDDKKVVIDEVAGMCISLLFLPVTLPVILAGLVLFRFFDIAKPLYIRKAEALPKGWGVMTDDIIAGVYANIILQVAVHFKWL